MKYDKQILSAAIRALIAGCRGETDHEFEYGSKETTIDPKTETEKESENEES